MRTATNWLDNPKRFHARNKHITVDDSPRSDEPLYTIYLLLLYDHNECYGLKRNSNTNGIAYQDFLYDTEEACKFVIIHMKGKNKK